VPCSNAANIEECKTWTQSEFCTWHNSVTGQEPPKCIYSISVVTVAGICNSVGGGVLFNIPPWWRWRISVQYAPCIAGEGQSSVPFPSPHPSSCRTRQLPPSLLIIRRRDAIVTAVVRVIDGCDDPLVQQCTSRLIALAVLGTKHFAATPLY